MRCVLALSLTVSWLSAQVPDGWLVFGSFQGTTGQNGLFFAHPRDPQQSWIPVTGLPAALAYDPAGRRGAACVARRDDGTLLAGERAPAGTSVDVHWLRLQGSNVVFAQLFSVGTSANVGEIPQLAPLPDGRVVVAATDLMAGGPLAQFQTLLYDWEGIGVLDLQSGGVVPVAIPNLNQFPGVINGLAISPDGTTLYVGNYVSAVAGDVWSVPVAGGPATQIATLPAGASNVAIDLDGSILVTTLNGPPNLFRIDAAAPHTVAAIATTTGPLNAIALESVTGNWLLATANAGVPARSLVWMTPGGQENVLASPGLATISCLDVNPNPESYGVGLPGLSDYRWLLRPNSGGLPLAGNGGFSLRMDAAAGEMLFTWLAFGMQRGSASVLGLPLLLDPAGIVGGAFSVSTGGPVEFPLAIPANPVLVGATLRAQGFVQEMSTSALAASPGVEFTVL